MLGALPGLGAGFDGAVPASPDGSFRAGGALLVGLGALLAGARGAGPSVVVLVASGAVLAAPVALVAGSDPVALFAGGAMASMPVPVSPERDPLATIGTLEPLVAPVPVPAATFSGAPAPPPRPTTIATIAIAHAATTPPAHHTTRFFSFPRLPAFATTATPLAGGPLEGAVAEGSASRSIAGPFPASRVIFFVGCLRGSTASAIRTGALGTCGAARGSITAAVCARTASSPATTIAPPFVGSTSPGSGTASRASAFAIARASSNRSRSSPGSTAFAGICEGS